MPHLTHSNQLVIISGPAATGKTTLGKLLSKELQLPYFYKDQFKEPFYDVLGFPDLEMHRKLGAISHQALNTICEELISKGVSHILEAPFSDEFFSPFLRELRAKHDFDIIQLQLKCQGDVLVKRFVDRENEGRSHPGHQGVKYLDALIDRLRRGEMDPLKVECQLRVIDTTDLSQVDYPGIVAYLRGFLGRG